MGDVPTQIPSFFIVKRNNGFSFWDSNSLITSGINKTMIPITINTIPAILKSSIYFNSSNLFSTSFNLSLKYSLASSSISISSSFDIRWDPYLEYWTSPPSKALCMLEEFFHIHAFASHWNFIKLSKTRYKLFSIIKLFQLIVNN